MRFRHWQESPAAQPLRAACRHRPAQRPGQAAPVSCTKVPTFHNPVTHIISYYSFNRPRRNGRLSWPCWLTDSGCFTHKVVTRPSTSLAQDKESSPAGTDILTTMLCSKAGHCSKDTKTSAIEWPNWIYCIKIARCTEIEINSFSHKLSVHWLYVGDIPGYVIICVFKVTC